MAQSAAPILTPPAPPPLVAVPDVGTDLPKYIKAYLAVREKKAAIKKRHKDEMAPVDRMLEILETGFQKHLLTTKTDSASSRGVGTIYLTEKASATIADAAAFRRHVIGAEAWDLVDWRANAVAVQKMLTESGNTPPGVNYSVITDVGIRRA